MLPTITVRSRAIQNDGALFQLSMWERQRTTSLDGELVLYLELAWELSVY